MRKRKVNMTKRLLNRIQKRIDIIFKYEREKGRGIGDVWGKVDMVLRVEKEKLKKQKEKE